MTPTFIWASIAGMAVTTYLLRAFPILFVSRLHVPRPVERWLGFVPVAVLASLVAGEVLRPGGAWLPPLSNPYLFAAAPTAFVYWRWRSLLGATVAGVLSFLAFRALLG